MNDLDARLSAWNPVRGQDLAGAAASAQATALLAHILGQPATAATRRHPRLRRRLRPWAAAAAAAAVTAGIVLAAHWPGSQHQPAAPYVPPGLHLVDFSARHGNVTALITDPYAAGSELTAVFRAHGLHIDVQMLPVSPSLVGTIIYTDAPVIGTLWKPGCSYRTCPIGLVIPASFSGTATVSVGRPARHGEHYESLADAFLPGEALHCSGLLGAPASAALPVLRKLGLTPTWWPAAGHGPQQATPAGYIIDADPASPATVNLDTLPELPRSTQFRNRIRQLNHGCR